MAESVSGCRVGNRKLGMWLFISSDSMTFAALLAAYAYLRSASAAWPVPFDSWRSLAPASLMTLLLLFSSLTMVSAVKASRNGNTGRAIRCIGFTLLAGLGFLVLHLNEWRALIQEGVRLSQNPWGTPLFGAAFFTLTGLHMAHVAAGLVYLGVIGGRLALARCAFGDVEVSAAYWYFVDAVWMLIFPTVYLLGLPAR